MNLHQARSGLPLAGQLVCLLFASMLLSIQSSQAFGGKGSGPRLCRFYSNMTKSCQAGCRAVSSSDFDAIIDKRGKEFPTLISMNEINNPFVDPILFVNCSDQANVSPWTQSQNFIFPPAAPGSAYEKADVYLGACVFADDKKHTWNCRGCDRDNTAQPIQTTCFVGGEDGYKIYFKKGWQQTGRDEGTLQLWRLPEDNLPVSVQ